MEAVKDLGVKRVVFCSSAAVYGEPEVIPVTEDSPLNSLNLYGITKIAGEKIVNSYWLNDGVENINLRFGNLYGIGLYTQWYAVIPKFVKMALNCDPLTIYGDGEATRDYIHIEDISHAVIKSLEAKGLHNETFNVGGETLSVNNVTQMVVEEVENATGKKTEILSLDTRSGETREFSYDQTRIKRGLGFKNKWRVREGIRQIINYQIQD
jgi:UDP-glucose 4-epimerase